MVQWFCLISWKTISWTNVIIGIMDPCDAKIYHIKCMWVSDLHSMVQWFCPIPYSGIFSRRQIFAVCLKNMRINFRGRQCPWKRKIILILFHENHRVGGTAQISLDRSTVQKENLRLKYLKRKWIKDTCILTDKKAKTTYLHSDGWIKWLFRTKQWNVCLACLLLELWKLCHTTFCHKTTRVFWR